MNNKNVMSMKKKTRVSLLQLLAEDAGWQKMSPKQFLIAIWFTLSFVVLPIVVTSSIENGGYVIAIVAVINFYLSSRSLKGGKYDVKE